jgi:queuine/archaeosine tRNA-ribosyltransferase
MSKALYVPAIGEQFNSVWARKLVYKGKDGREFDMKFFTEQSHFQLPVALQSAYYGLNGVNKRHEDHYREMVKYPKDKILVGDSGGFQIASFKIRGEECNLTPLESLRWMEENCDVGMNLDVPPNLDGNPVYEDFVKALDESVENFKFFQDNRVNYNMKLLNVLHGENIPLMDVWYNKVKDFKFEGWAIGMKPPFDPLIQALGFMYLWEKGEFEKDSCKWIHFFGTSGKHVVPTIVYAAHKLKKDIPVSYDSSSYNIGSIYRTYYMPFDVGPHLSFGDKFLRVNPHLKELPCKCPVCASIKDINELNTTDIYAGTLLSLHNMYQYQYYNDILLALVTNKDMFLDYLQKIGISEKTLKSIEFIDYCIEKGLANGVDKYKADLIPQEINKSKQANIWRF